MNAQTAKKEKPSAVSTPVLKTKPKQRRQTMTQLAKFHITKWIEADLATATKLPMDKIIEEAEALTGMIITKANIEGIFRMLQVTYPPGPKSLACVEKRLAEAEAQLELVAAVCVQLATATNTDLKTPEFEVLKMVALNRQKDLFKD